MRALSLSAVLAVTAVVCVSAALPATYYSVTMYATPNCTGTATSGPDYYGMDICKVNSGNTGIHSVKYVTTTANTVQTNSYTSYDCTGTPTINNGTYANLQCDRSGTSSAKYAFPAPGSFWALTTYSTNDCTGTPTDGPTVNLLGACIGGGSGGYALYNVQGHNLAIGRYSAADCSGTATNSYSIPKGCLDTTQTGGSPQSSYYDFNAAVAHAPAFAVAAIAVVIAFASQRL